MRTRHGLPAGLLAAAVLAATFSVARAQGPPSVRLILEKQTPWASLRDPVVRLRVRAENLSDSTLDDLSFGIGLGSAVRTRTAYDLSLTSGPTLPLFAETRPETASLPPGADRTFDFKIDLLKASTGVSRTDSLIYPLRVDLRSGDEPTGAELHTPIPFMVRRPVQPLELSWSLEIAPPPAIDLAGRLVDGSLPLEIATGGALRAEIDALGSLATSRHPSPVDVAIAPRFLDELRVMSDGFQTEEGVSVEAGKGASADAVQVLRTLSAIARSGALEVSALPYAAPALPSLLGSRLGRDLAEQVRLGNSVFQSILGAAPDASVTRPTGGALDQTSLDDLADWGTKVVLGSADTLPRPPSPGDLTPAPTGLLTAAGGSVPVVLPDPGIQALLGSSATSDPVLTAQKLLGELAAVWQEAPATPKPRGVAISTSGLSLPASFWRAVAGRIAKAPFLHPVAATRLVRDVPPGPGPNALQGESSSSFSREYVDGIRAERRRIDAVRSMLVAGNDPADSLDTALLVAESGAFVGDERSGRRWIDEVNAATGTLFQAARPPGDQVFTLPSTSGTIPIRLGDPGDRSLRVEIELSSSKLRFPEGAIRAVTLDRPNQIVFFPVEANTTGRIIVQILVRAPSGSVVQTANLIVQSTAYNDVALLVTFGAAFALVALWARRLLRRRTS